MFKINYHTLSRLALDTLVQCDAIRWKQLENGHFSKGYDMNLLSHLNFENSHSSVFDDLCLAKVFSLTRSCLNMWFISSRLMKTENNRVSVFELFRSDFITLFKKNIVFRPLCENYVIKWTRQGMAKDLDQLNNFRVRVIYFP